MSLLEWIWNLFRKPKFIKIPVVIEITGDEVNKILSTISSNLLLSDDKYILVNDNDLIEFLRINTVDKRKYILETHDCDDFALELAGNVSEWNPAFTFGEVWGLTVNGDAHAWNVYINTKKEIRYVEPQNDKIFVPSTEKPWFVKI